MKSDIYIMSKYGLHLIGGDSREGTKTGLQNFFIYLEKKIINVSTKI